MRRLTETQPPPIYQGMLGVSGEATMADIRVQIPDEVLDDLRKKLNLATGTDVMTEALRILNWAVEEKEKNRSIYSLDVNNRAQTKLSLKSLMN